MDDDEFGYGTDCEPSVAQSLFDVGRELTAIAEESPKFAAGAALYAGTLLAGTGYLGTSVVSSLLGA
jgi:hypothetical protein